MKKYFIIAAAALVSLCACTKNEVAQPENQKEVSFQVANYLSQTKADADTPLAYYSDGHFGTFAFQIPEGYTWKASEATVSDKHVAGDNDKSVFMDNVKIYYHENDNVWKAEKTYYWPKTGSLTFASYSPIDSESACGAEASCDEDAIVKIAGWKVNTDNSAQAKNYTDDLMWADVICDQTANVNPATYQRVSGVSEGVPTLFHHALAKVNLKARMAETASGSAYEYAVYVTKVIIDGIEYKGDYTVGTGWGNRSTDRGGDPSIYSNTVSYTVGADYVEGTDVLGTTEATAVDLFSNYFVLPQELVAAGQTLEIQYTIVTIDPDTNKIVLVEETTSGAIDIKDMDLDAWGENKNITYTATIAPTQATPILFDPAVADWEIVSGTADIPVTE